MPATEVFNCVSVIPPLSTPKDTWLSLTKEVILVPPSKVNVSVNKFKLSVPESPANAKAVGRPVNPEPSPEKDPVKEPVSIVDAPVEVIDEAPMLRRVPL